MFLHLETSALRETEQKTEQLGSLANTLTESGAKRTELYHKARYIHHMELTHSLVLLLLSRAELSRPGPISRFHFHTSLWFCSNLCNGFVNDSLNWPKSLAEIGVMTEKRSIFHHRRSEDENRKNEILCRALRYRFFRLARSGFSGRSIRYRNWIKESNVK